MYTANVRVQILPSILAFAIVFFGSVQSMVIHSTQVPTVAVKQRLDVYLSENFGQYSRSSIGSLCEMGNVLVNDKVQTKSYKVQKGDLITFSVEEKAVSNVTPEDIPLDIIYEDKDLILVNKPSGMVVHPAVGSPNGTFVNALLHHLGSDAYKLLDQTNAMELSGDSAFDDELDIDLPETPEAAVASPATLRPGIVHRLDKGTTGVLMAVWLTAIAMSTWNYIE